MEVLSFGGFEAERFGDMLEMQVDVLCLRAMSVGACKFWLM